jgi:hypothetical protein
MKTCISTIRLIALLGLANAAAPLYSTTIEYSSRSTWQLAVSNIVTTTFDVAVAGYYTPPAPNAGIGLGFGGITLNGVTFQGYNNNAEYGLQLVTAGSSTQYYNWGTGGTILRGDLYQGALARLHISLPNAVTAWGTDLMLGSTPGGTYTVQVNGNPVCVSQSCLAPTFAFPNAAFFGMTSDTPFTTIDLFYPINTYAAIDNFSRGTASTQAPPPPIEDTPEVATLFLCASGLCGLAKLRKLRSLTLA